MKKINLMAICIPILNLTAYGAFLHVETITPFSTPEPPKIVKLKSLGELQLTKEILIHEGDILTGEITNIKRPKRLKRNATFKYQINSVQSSNNDNHRVSEHNIGKYRSEINKRNVATSAALKVGELFVSGITVSYRAVEGAVVNREDGVSGAAQGAVKNVYNNSIFSYIKKGVEVDKKEGDRFYLSLKPEKVSKKRAKAESHSDALIEESQTDLDQ